MSDIKNLFVETFKGCNFSQFPVSDLKKLGFKLDKKEPKINQQKAEGCTPKRKRIKPAVDPIEKLIRRNKIIPSAPNENYKPIRKHNKHFKSMSIMQEMQINKNRNKLYYHSHREELKWKRLVKEGREDVIELLLNSLPDSQMLD